MKNLKAFEARRAGLLFVAAMAIVAVLFHSAAYAEGGLVKIADGVYSYVDAKGGLPANSFGANAGIIVGRDSIAVVDTLISAKLARRFVSDIRAVSDKPIRYVINTHSHLDHTFGNSELAKTGAILISSENCRINMKKNSEAVLKNTAAYGLTAQDMEGTAIAYPTVMFADRMSLDLGDMRVELISVAESHTDDSLIVYVPGVKTLFAGDILFTGYHPYLADGDIPAWGKSLDAIKAMDVEKIIPGHGPVSTKKDLDDMKSYLTLFDAKARELAAKTNNADVILDGLKKALPARPEGAMLIMGNIKGKYLRH
jgi:glyoxylase-like metal-dependent hydrolase (beta-lactamase superfamily II)